ncbi:hypothetical protein Dimus_039397 [Dionaea muscipula]
MTPEEREQFRTYQMFTTARGSPEVEASQAGTCRRPRRGADSTTAPAARGMTRAPLPEEVQGRMFERFLGIGPSKFKGSGDPIEAGNWLMEMEKILKRIGCPTDFWVSNASFQLKDDAKFWWQGIERKYAGREHALTWDTFVREFHGKYYTVHARAQKKIELLSLKQGDMKISAYDAKFSELSRFAPELVSTEKDKMFLFLKGMDPDLQVLVRGLMLVLRGHGGEGIRHRESASGFVGTQCVRDLRDSDRESRAKY